MNRQVCWHCGQPAEMHDESLECPPADPIPHLIAYDRLAMEICRDLDIPDGAAPVIVQHLIGWTPPVPTHGSDKYRTDINEDYANIEADSLKERLAQWQHWIKCEIPLHKDEQEVLGDGTDLASDVGEALARIEALEAESNRWNDICQHNREATDALEAENKWLRQSFNNSDMLRATLRAELDELYNERHLFVKQSAALQEKLDRQKKAFAGAGLTSECEIDDRGYCYTHKCWHCRDEFKRGILEVCFKLLDAPGMPERINKQIDTIIKSLSDEVKTNE